MRKTNWDLISMGKKLVFSHEAPHRQQGPGYGTRGHGVKGVFVAWWMGEPGTSIMGEHVAGAEFIISAKERHLELLNQLRAMPKPKLPKDL